MNRILVLVLLFLCCEFSLFARNSEVLDSLTTAYTKSSSDSLKALILREMSWEYLSVDRDSSLNYARQSLRISTQANCLNCEAKAFSQIATVFYYHSDFPNALDNFQHALRINQKINNKRGILACFNNLGGIHVNLKNFDKAKTYFEQSLYFAKELNDTSTICASLANLGICFRHLQETNKAIDFFKQAFKLTHQPSDLFDIYFNLAGAYKDVENYSQSLAYYEKCYQIAEQLDENTYRAYALAGIASISGKMNNFQRAVEKSRAVLNLIGHGQYLSLEKDVYDMLGHYNYKLKNYKDAFENLQKSIEINDSLFSDEKSKILLEAEIKFGVENKEKENELLKKNSVIQELAINEKDAKIRARNYLLFAGIIGILLLVILAALIYGRYNLKKRANQKLEEAFKIISEKNKDIIDSMNYARNLQDALLPKLNSIKHNFTDSFVIFRPKDIVSGDFFWMGETKEHLFFAVADCTGHGVPAAIVSVIALNGLTRCVQELKLTQPDAVLSQLNEFVEESFQHGENEIRDGLDIALCSFQKSTFDKDFIEFDFCGANNPVWIITHKSYLPNGIDERCVTFFEDQVLFEVKGNKRPIGLYTTDENFDKVALRIRKGDSIFMFSDGYADQFGGPEGKKFKYARLKKLLLSIAHLPMGTQSHLINEQFDDWKNNLEQIDDVCVVGLKF